MTRFPLRRKIASTGSLRLRADTPLMRLFIWRNCSLWVGEMEVFAGSMAEASRESTITASSGGFCPRHLYLRLRCNRWQSVTDASRLGRKINYSLPPSRAAPQHRAHTTCKKKKGEKKCINSISYALHFSWSSIATAIEQKGKHMKRSNHNQL